MYDLKIYWPWPNSEVLYAIGTIRRCWLLNWWVKARVNCYKLQFLEWPPGFDFKFKSIPISCFSLNNSLKQVLKQDSKAASCTLKLISLYATVTLWFKTLDSVCCSHLLPTYSEIYMNYLHSEPLRFQTEFQKFPLIKGTVAAGQIFNCSTTSWQPVVSSSVFPCCFHQCRLIYCNMFGSLPAFVNQILIVCKPLPNLDEDVVPLGDQLVTTTVCGLPPYGEEI